LQILGEHHGLGKGVVRQLHQHREIEANRALSDISGPALDVAIVAQQPLEVGHGLLRRRYRRVLRQLHVDEKLGPVGGRKELPGHEGEPDHGKRKRSAREHHSGPAPPHAEQQHFAKSAQHPSRFGTGAVLLRKQHHAEQRREDGGDEPGGDERNGHHRKQRKQILAGRALGHADRKKRRHRHQRAGAHRKVSRHVGVSGRLGLAPTFLELPDHHLDGDHRVVDQETERDDEGAERDPLQRDIAQVHEDEHGRQDHRDRQGHHGARAQSEAQEADRNHDDQRLYQGSHEVADGMGHHVRLIRHKHWFDPNGQAARD
jgi:hypothetical protein